MSDAPRTPLNLSFEDLRGVFIELMDAIRQHVSNQVDPISARLDASVGRFADIEAKLLQLGDERARYRGAHSKTEQYYCNDICTWGGNLWYALHPSKATTPGDNSGTWLLMAKGVAPDQFAALERRLAHFAE